MIKVRATPSLADDLMPAKFSGLYPAFEKQMLCIFTGSKFILNVIEIQSWRRWNFSINAAVP